MSTGGVSYPGSKPSVKLKKPRPKVAVRPKKKNPPLAKPKAKQKPATAPYDPLAPLAPSAIEENARAQAMTQVQPQIDALSSVNRDLTGSHDTRQQELKGWYTGLQSNLDKSFTQTSDALNAMIASNNAGSSDANATLAAALRGGDQTVANAAGMMNGVAAPPDQDAAILAAANANASNQNSLVGANALNALQASGDRRPLASVGLMESGLAENRRYDAQKKEYVNQAMDVANRIPELQNVAQQDIQALETQKGQLGEARANRLFQQWLAEKELNLKSRNQSFQEYLGQQQLGIQQQGASLDAAKFKHQSQIDWAQIGLNQREIEAKLAEINGGKKDERGKLRAKQWDTGLSMLQGYMKPGEGEANPGVTDPKQLIDKDGNPLQPYRRKYDDAFRILTGQARMAKTDALRVLAASDFPSWRKRANQELKRIKSGLSSNLDKVARGPTSLSKKPPTSLKKGR
jgi:hypothetical protein